MTVQTKEFKTEVKQLLDLVIHSLYSKREIFLRELISNASDAIDRLRFESITDQDILEGDDDFKIKLSVDKDKRILTVSDNGIGMTADEVESNIGTIANSGTRAFLQTLQQTPDSNKAEFIGQFGVGFYAAFMVADRVTLLTRRAGGSEAVRWESTGDGRYSIEPSEKASRGTDVILHLREDAADYLEEFRIRSIVSQYSDYIAFPIVMNVTRQEKEGDTEKEVAEEERLNSQKAIWKRAKTDIAEDEYKEFYKHIAHDFSEPLHTIHYKAEGALEFQALLYIPSRAPFDLYWSEGKRGVHLYVRNVFITDDAEELLPSFLRFIRGVVDSSDLPLNVSREMLQDDAVIRKISRNLVGKILNELDELKKTNRDRYRTFYEEFGPVLKEGLHSAYDRREQLRELAMYRSTTSDDAPVALSEYVGRMPEGQKAIYYITAESLDAVKSSPHLEAFRKKGYEVLFMTDPIDEWALQGLEEYDGKPFEAVHRGDVDLAAEDEQEAVKSEREQSTKELGGLLEFIQDKLKDDIKEVRISSRLTDSPVCLVADTGQMDANMERIMRAMNQEVPKSKRILEINARHPLIAKMKSIFDTDRGSARLAEYIELLYDQALLTEGSRIKDPARFARLVSDLMVDAS